MCPVNGSALAVRTRRRSITLRRAWQATKPGAAADPASNAFSRARPVKVAGPLSFIVRRRERTVRPSDRSLRLGRRLLASLAVAVLIFGIGYVWVFVAPAPERAIYNISANPVGILFVSSALFVVFGLPLWAASFLALSLVGHLLSSGRRRVPPSAARRGGGDG